MATLRQTEWRRLVAEGAGTFFVLVGGHGGPLWIYLVGPLAGAALAVALAWVLRGPPSPTATQAAQGADDRTGGDDLDGGPVLDDEAAGRAEAGPGRDGEADEWAGRDENQGTEGSQRRQREPPLER